MPSDQPTIIIVEIAGDRTVSTDDRAAQREAVDRILRDSLDSVGIHWASYDYVDRGTHFLIQVPPDEPRLRLAAELPLRILSALVEYNIHHPQGTRTALRLALHVGDESTAADLLAQPIPDIRESSWAVLAIMSDEFHRLIFPGVSADSSIYFRRTLVGIGDRQSTVWLRVLSSDQIPPPLSGAVRVLGNVHGVELGVVHTDEPWRLPVDAIVISMGDRIGGLGRAVLQQFPALELAELDLMDVRPEGPRVFEVASTLYSVRWLVFAAVRDPQARRVPTTRAIGVATGSAIVAAVEAGAERVAVSLLGTGGLGMNRLDAAMAAVPAATSAAERPGWLARITFFDSNPDTIGAVTSAWNSIMPDIVSTELAGGVSGDLVDPNRGIPLSEDHLGVAPYVSMMATVIADCRTPMPLSIGIFGEWGSGKSYFMGLLRGQVDALAKSGNPEYHGDIVQIGFNAWHYADSNLWASLGDEIFRQLAGPETTAQQRRDQIRAELTDKLGQRRQLDTVTQQARRTTAELKARVEDAAGNRQIATQDLLAAMQDSAELKTRLKNLWDGLGIDDDVDKAKLLAKQLHGDLTDVEALRRAPRDRYGKVALAAAAVILVCIGIAVLALPTLTEWFAGIGGVIAVVSAVLGGTWVSRARAGVRALRALSEDLRSGLAERLPELAQLRQAEADQQVAEAQLAEVVSQVGELGRQLAELAPGQRLYAFLAERSYTHDLGLVSVIRKDFQQLVALMDDWRRNPQPDESGRKPIDRIVLYIDDLDRCGPKQVVEVLQAVHLILALELFVVVVGVDPRWLLRALCSHYAEILDTEELSDGWRVTPEDYLEKIINIPLVLPNLPSGSLSSLLRSMIEDVPTPTTEPVRTIQTPAPVAPEPLPDTVPVEVGSEVDSQRRHTRTQRHPLTDNELALLERLDLLLDTPREAKRLFNLYRMVRATRDLSERSAFLGEDDHPGEYQAVILLLGMITADSRLAALTFDALARRDSDSAWPEFVADLKPREGRNNIVGTVTDEHHWQRLHSGLAAASDQVTLTDLDVFQLWIPRIRRFSYVLNGTAPR